MFDPFKSARYGYQQPSADQIEEAQYVSAPARKKLKRSNQHADTVNDFGSADATVHRSTFPSPLVLPGDHLWHDPDEPQQSVQEWIELPERNKVTNRRRTIYVVPPPGVSNAVLFVKDWMTPKVKTTKMSDCPKLPRTEDVVDYLAAFYHGLPVRIFDTAKLEFMNWDNPEPSSQKKAPTSPHIALSTGSEAIRIRTRTLQGKAFDGQLNLNDLLDVAISILPSDAYALLMLVHHDLFEDDEDDFCCGRAYGGSRVAVVSTARYRPELDGKSKIDREHSWPASHCSRYMSRFFSNKTLVLPPPETVTERHPASALATAVATASALPSPSSNSELSELWLGRACKTASHELGHCFGIGHCTYFACIMQGTMHLAEDARQPPYLCHIDLAKILRATASDKSAGYRALLEFCGRRKEDRMFSGFGAWLQERIGIRHTSLSPS